MVTPDGYLSASHHLAHIAPGPWALDWVADAPEPRAVTAGAFGIDAADLASVVRWATDSFGEAWGWPHAVYSLEVAREFCRRFVPTPVRLLGLALPDDLVRRGYLHSFRDDDLEREFQERYGARYNQFALIADAGIARACADYADLDPCCATLCLLGPPLSREHLPTTRGRQWARPARGHARGPGRGAAPRGYGVGADGAGRLAPPVTAAGRPGRPS
jgi:hypothetical protein